MIINQANLEALRTGFKADFQNGLKKAAPVSDPFVTPVTSSTKVETYGFLGDLPIFRKWLGDKRIRSLKEKVYQLANDDFEATIGIHKNKIRDDNLGLYPNIVSGWGESGGMLRDRLAFDALRYGHQRVCYDGQNFFDNDHPIGPEAAGAIASNVDTTGAVQPWYLVDCSKPLKPIMHQKRQDPTFHMVVDEQDSQVFKTGEFMMGGEARGAAGYTFWQLAYKSTATLNAANFEAARTAMAALVDDEGEPLEVKPTHIVVGPSNLAAAQTLFEAQNLAGGASNIYWKRVQVIEAQRLP